MAAAVAPRMPMAAGKAAVVAARLIQAAARRGAQRTSPEDMEAGRRLKAVPVLLAADQTFAVVEGGMSTPVDTKPAWWETGQGRSMVKRKLMAAIARRGMRHASLAAQTKRSTTAAVMVAKPASARRCRATRAKAEMTEPIAGLTADHLSAEETAISATSAKPSRAAETGTGPIAPLPSRATIERSSIAAETAGPETMAPIGSGCDFATLATSPATIARGGRR